MCKPIVKTNGSFTALIRELSRYNEQLGAAVSYLLETVQQSSPGDSGKKNKSAAKRKSAGKSGQVTPGSVSSH